MEFDDVINSRRTCRDYQQKDVPMSILGEILDTARFAPSSANIQNWRFIVVKDKEKREEISNICSEQYWMADAPVHVVVCNLRSSVTKDFPKKGELFSIQNCAIIAVNIMLKAQDLGVSSAWVGAFDEDKIRRSLDIPDEVNPEIILTLGYSEEIGEDSVREEIKFLAFFEKWGKKDQTSSFWPLSKQVKVITKKTNQSVSMAKARAAGKFSRIKEKLRK